MPTAETFDRRSIAVLATGHCFADVCQGAIPALMPFMVLDRGYSYSQATALLLVMTFSSSLLQPAFGFLSDRRSLDLLLPGGVLLAGIGIALVGFVSSFEATLAAVFISGLGVGAYHPEGARFANRVSGGQRATGMSLYAVGGNIGFALGPITVTALVLPFGLGGMVWVLIPMLTVALLVMAELSRMRGGALFSSAVPPDPGGPQPSGPARPENNWPAFGSVAAVAGFRSAAYFALQAFVPLWFIHHLDQTAAIGNTALTVLLVSGAIGTLIGGRVADRVDMRLVIAVSLGATVPLILSFLALGPVLATVALGATGFFMVGTFSITVVLGQQYLPRRIGLASGVTLGAAIGFGGLVAWLLALLADQQGLLTVLVITALLPVPAVAFTRLLPPVDESDR